MKLTVGRIVHAHEAFRDLMTPGGWLKPDTRPHAAIVTLVAESAAYLRVLDHHDPREDRTVKVSLNPDEQRGPGGDGWVWRWPPREDAAKPAAKTEHESGCTGLCRGCCP